MVLGEIVKSGFRTLKRDLSGVRLGGFLRVIRELQIGNDGFKSAVTLQLKANVFGCLVVRSRTHWSKNNSLCGDVLPSAAQQCWLVAALPVHQICEQP